MNNEPIHNMANQISEAMNQLATMAKVGSIGIIILLVLSVALRVSSHRRRIRKMDQVLADAKLIADRIAEAIQAGPQLYVDEVEATPFDHAVSIAINNAFDADTAHLKDDDLAPGEEASMHVMSIEEQHYCEHCNDETGVAVTLLLQKDDGTPASMITQVACSVCHQVLVQ
jgi:hypothetical protein